MNSAIREATECKQCGADLMDGRRKYCNQACKHKYEMGNEIVHECGICGQTEKRLVHGIPRRLNKNEYCSECYPGVMAWLWMLRNATNERKMDGCERVARTYLV